MAQVEPIQTRDFDAIYEQFLADDDARISRQDWERLFTPFGDNNSEFGFKLVDHGHIVGVLGTIFSRREVDGRTVDFCNLHSWYVATTHRGFSLMLMRPILQMDDRVVTDLTPTPPVARLSRRLGFQELDATLRIMLSTSGQGNHSGSSSCLYWNESIDEGRLAPAERRIHRHHELPLFERLLIQDGAETCYVILRRVELHWRPYSYILHVSSPQTLAKAQAVWRPAVLARMRSRFIAADDRILPAEFPNSFRLPWKTTQFYRSKSIRPESIDALYTEVSQLGLTTFPSLRSFLRPFNRRFSSYEGS